MKKQILFSLALALGAVALGGCDFASAPPTPVDKLAQQAEKAAQDAARDTVTPQEIEMIEFRRHVMGRPGLQLYVTFLNDMGQPIEYFVTEGKCSSSNKRLTDDTKLVEGDKGSYTGYFDVPAASEDGTYGESDEYIFCKTADGKYKQWNGDYYASDSPVELTIKPLIVSFVKPGQNGNQSQH